ncbi:50S ribosomal protein L5 [Candidatus Sumerlaeota bacterium]|nr:50S ribosomal protein L5 [Candidatus Sumerlaeota bacterium]
MAAAVTKSGSSPEAYTIPRLLHRYRTEVVDAMMKKFEYGNVMQVPRLKKITVNMGVGEASRDIKELDAAEKEMSVITGQKPRTTRAKVSVSTFKIRQGMPIGCFVTLRNDRMWEFMDRLTNIALPRVRDFRGLPSRSFDGRGNYSMGVKEHLIFVELEYNMIQKNRGMNITFVTDAKTDAEAKELLRLLGMPFRN